MCKYKSQEEASPKNDMEDLDNWMFGCRATKDCKHYTYVRVPVKKIEFVDVKCEACKKCFRHYFVPGGYPWNSAK